MALKFITAIPFSGRYVPPEWALSMINLRYPRNARHGFYATKGLQRDVARDMLIQKSITEESEYVFFVDDDTAPPLDAPSLLTQVLDTSDPDVMVCGGIYTTKQ